MNKPPTTPLHLVVNEHLGHAPMSHDLGQAALEANFCHQGHQATRHDGLPLDALPDRALQPDTADAAAADWDLGVHVPSYVAGWSRGCMVGLFAGCVLVLCCFITGWVPLS